MFLHRSADPRYTRQQTMHWLAWLARALQRESQAILFIERMQPGWLPAPEQRQLYGIGEGLGAGLSAGLGAGMFYGAAVAFSNLPLAGPIGRWWAGGIAAGLGSTARLATLPLIGLAVGLVAGIAGGLFDWLVSLVTAADRGPPVASWRRPLTTLLRAGGAIGLTVGLVVGSFYGVSRATLAGLSIGLVGGLVLALRAQPGRIQIIERLTWRWSRALAGAALGLGVGLPAGLLFWRIQDRPSWLVIWPVGAMLAFGLIFGLSGKAIETRTRPNQGIRRSARTALWVGGAVWLCVGLLIVVATGMPDVQVAGLADRSLFGLMFGLVAGLFFGLMCGGIACFQHVLVRLILWRGDAMPWRYADFLDYCADHILLYRVGGGYMFVHRLLLEYFAVLDTSRT